MKKMEKIISTDREIKMATHPNVYRNKKKYIRNEKHRKLPTKHGSDHFSRFLIKKFAKKLIVCK